MVRKRIDIKANPSKEQIAMLEAAVQRPIEYDENCRKLTELELSEFKQISEFRSKSRTKQTVTLRLSPQSLEKAKSLGKGYTSVLSRILEAALSNNDIIKQYL